MAVANVTPVRRLCVAESSSILEQTPLAFREKRTEITRGGT